MLRGSRSRIALCGCGAAGTTDERIDVLVRRCDHCDELSHRGSLVLRQQSLAQHAFAARDELHDRLIRLDLGERLAVLDLVAFVLEPLHEATLLHRRRERLHHDLRCHTRSPFARYSMYMTFLTAAIAFAASGLAARSRFFAYGIGTSA